MTKNVYGVSTSNLRVIRALGLASGQIVLPITRTLEQYSGQSITIDVSGRNVGADAGNLVFRTIDVGTGATFDAAISDIVEVDATAFYGRTYPTGMPNKDFVLRVEVGHFDVNSVFVRDDYVNFTIILLIAVPTTLVLDIMGSVPIGKPYTYSGKLTRTDTAVGLDNMRIYCDRDSGGGNWAEVGNGLTNATGVYSISVNAPAVQGNYPTRTRFLGATTLGLTYGPSSSDVRELVAGLAVADNSLENLAVMSLSGLALGGLGYYGSNKNVNVAVPMAIGGLLLGIAIQRSRNKLMFGRSGLEDLCDILLYD